MASWYHGFSSLSLPLQLFLIAKLQHTHSHTHIYINSTSNLATTHSAILSFCKDSLLFLVSLRFEPAILLACYLLLQPQGCKMLNILPSLHVKWAWYDLPAHLHDLSHPRMGFVASKASGMGCTPHSSGGNSGGTEAQASVLPRITQRDTYTSSFLDLKQILWTGETLQNWTHGPVFLRLSTSTRTALGDAAVTCRGRHL